MYLIVNSVYAVIAPLPFRYAMADIYTKKKKKVAKDNH